MKALICKQCNSNELVKQGEAYVCTFCGTQYTDEEIKKMQIEGTVKIDNSEMVERFLQNARRAKQKEDWDETEKYYNMVEQNDPSNIEAIFYSSYGKAKVSLVDSDLYKRQAAFKILKNCVSIIDDNFELEKEEENRKIIDDISNDIIAMACSTYVYNQRKNGYGVVTWSDKLETVTLFNTLSGEFMTTLENIAKKIPETERTKRIYYYKIALKHAEYVLENGSLASPKTYINIVMEYHRIIHNLDPSHIVPSESPKPGKKQSAGCYVATAVYGSYDCPEVWTLRRYRDYTLSETFCGRAFIKVYYFVSPTLVKLFGHTDWFKNMWRGKLDRMVADLQAKGVESTPYEDRTWK